MTTKFVLWVAMLMVSMLAISRVRCNSLVHIGGSDDKTDLSEKAVAKDTFTAAGEFIPTNEWQEIKPGQSIPRGLHVRINFQTGLKEAKLLEPESGGQQRLIGEDAVDVPLEEALKNIASSHDEPSGNTDSGPVPTNKKTFRSIEEIKRSFAKQNVSLSSEMELVTKLYTRLLQGDHPGQVLTMLDDLEFYVHKYDNAVHFTDLGGVELLNHLIATSSDVGIVAKASLVLGSAAQSNTYVAKAASDSGAVPTLLKRLGNASDDTTLCNRLLFAISSLARTHTDVIAELIKYDGASVFRSIIGDAEVKLKSKVKIYTLMDDLLASGREKNSSAGIQKLLGRQGLAEAMCHKLALFLQQSTPDQLDKLLSFLNRSLSNDVCKKYSSQLISVLTTIEEKYTGQLKGQEADDFYQSLVDRITLAKSYIALRNNSDHLTGEL